MHSYIIVIGAGASGLLAARNLAHAGLEVRILEARDRIGGRIHTIHDPNFSRPVEMGAEFIHGKLPITLCLLKEYKLNHHKLKGRLWTVENGEVIPSPEYIPGANELDAALKELQEDMSVRQFLDTYLSQPEHRPLYDDIQRFVEGYDAADVNLASALAFKKEWNDTDSGQQFRPTNGYAALMDALLTDCLNQRVQLELHATVKHIFWEGEKIEITTADHKKYTADKVLITVPLGVWQSDEGEEAHIHFHPRLDHKTNAAKQLGYGSVVKVMLQFTDAFWNHHEPKEFKKKLGFLFTHPGIPTWWTQDTGDVPMLVGWMGGPPADVMKNAPDNIVIDYALNTLSQVFPALKSELLPMLKAHYISRWTEDPFSLGAYSYSVVGGDWHKHTLLEPMHGKLYFAGEALDDGGTVEAAFSSAQKVVKLMTQ